MWDNWYQIRGRICSILERMMWSNLFLIRL
ncbi:hypothetical protein LINGRAHAP2_LOCUS34439 [Linum grandiflorum]